MAGVAGFVDVAGYLALRELFVAHMSGNAARLGVALGHGHVSAAIPYLVAIACFVGGIAIGTVIADARGRRAVLAAEAVLLAALMVYGGASSGADGTIAGNAVAPYYVVVVLAVATMGFQTAALLRVEGHVVRTTYISGLLTNMTRAAVAGDRRRAGLLAAVFTCYLTGAVLGSVGHERVGLWALGAPLAVLVACALTDRARASAPGVGSPEPW